MSRNTLIKEKIIWNLWERLLVMQTLRKGCTHEKHLDQLLSWTGAPQEKCLYIAHTDWCHGGDNKLVRQGFILICQYVNLLIPINLFYRGKTKWSAGNANTKSARSNLQRRVWCSSGRVSVPPIVHSHGRWTCRTARCTSVQLQWTSSWSLGLWHSTPSKEEVIG